MKTFKIDNPDRTFFTSDLHFGHRMQTVDRGFASMTLEEFRNRPEGVTARDAVTDDEVKSMDDAILSKINLTVGAMDTLFIVGDFSLHAKADQVAYWRDQIDCQNVILCGGNHDDYASVKDAGFQGLIDMGMVRYRQNKATTRIMICHYPMLDWQDAHKGVIHCHGHEHGAHDNGDLKRFDIGIDASDIARDLGYINGGPLYGPWSFNDIADAAETRTSYPNIGHHVYGG